MSTAAASAFAAFRDRVDADSDLQRALNQAMDHEAYIAHVVDAGARAGFVFGEAEVRDAKRDGHRRFLMQWIPGQGDQRP